MGGGPGAKITPSAPPPAAFSALLHGTTPHQHALPLLQGSSAFMAHMSFDTSEMSEVELWHQLQHYAQVDVGIIPLVRSRVGLQCMSI